MSNEPVFTYNRPYNWRHFLKHPIFNEYPEEMVREIMWQSECELEYSFPGFLDIYESLSKIIPEYFTILDLGCYLSAQCWYFRNHEKYVGVDTTKLKRFSINNVEHYVGKIEDFLAEHEYDFNKMNTFAIYSYAGTSLSSLIAEKFPRCFCYFPGEKEHIFNNNMSETMIEFKKSEILTILGNKESRDMLYTMLKEAKIGFN